MNTNFKILEANVSIVETVNNVLMKKSVEIERLCLANAQYSRREFLEIAGITTSILQPGFRQKLQIKFQSFSDFSDDLKQNSKTFY